MASEPTAAPAVLPTNAAPLARLFAYPQALGLERCLHRAKRGVPTLVLALLWLALAWRGSGRPTRAATSGSSSSPIRCGRPRLPCTKTLRAGLSYVPARALRAAGVFGA
jgi:hypothetical protein